MHEARWGGRGPAASHSSSSCGTASSPSSAWRRCVAEQRALLLAPHRLVSDWFLYGPKLEGAARDAFIAELAPLDPVKWLPKLRGRVLLQFAADDEHVSAARREQLVAAAPKGAESRVYKAGHDLNELATRDRLAWLRQVLALK